MGIFDNARSFARFFVVVFGKSDRHTCLGAKAFGSHRAVGVKYCVTEAQPCGSPIYIFCIEAVFSRIENVGKAVFQSGIDLIRRSFIRYVGCTRCIGLTRDEVKIDSGIIKSGEDC